MNEMRLDQEVFKTVPRPQRTLSRAPGSRRLSRFEVWAWSPVISFQVGLTLGYLAMIYFGVASLVSRVPAFDVTAPHGWTSFWACGLVLGGLLAAIGSVSRHKAFETLELVGAFLVTLAVGTYTTVLHFLSYIQGDANRAAVAAGILVVTVPVLIRTLWLASQIFRR